MSGARPRPGGVYTITSVANERIKDIRALDLPKRRKETGLFVAEGLKLVADALAEDWPVRTFVHALDAADQPAVQRAAATARARGADILQVSHAVLEKISRRDNPQTVLGVFSQRLVPAGAMKPGPGGVTVVLEAIRDPGNLGTILRTVDAVGGDGVILVGPVVDPFSLEAVRATMGSIFHVPIAKMSETDFLAFRAGWPGVVVGTHLSGTEDYRRVAYDRPTLLLMGNEQAGLTPTLVAACDHVVRIPQAGRADSLNLAVATAVMLYEVRRSALSLTETRSPPATPA